EGDADALEQQLGLAPALQQGFRGDVGEPARKLGIGRPNAAVRAAHLVERRNRGLRPGDFRRHRYPIRGALPARAQIAGSAAGAGAGAAAAIKRQGRRKPKRPPSWTELLDCSWIGQRRCSPDKAAGARFGVAARPVGTLTARGQAPPAWRLFHTRATVAGGGGDAGSSAAGGSDAAAGVLWAPLAGRRGA